MNSIKPKAFSAVFSTLSFLGAAMAFAQEPPPKVVTGQAVLAKSAVHAGDVFKVALVLKIDKGWHINSDNPGDEFMFPSSLALDEGAGFKTLEVAFPKPKAAKFEYSEFELMIYEDEAVVGALVQADPGLKPGRHKLAGKFRYQACDSQSCIMPQDLPFELMVEVVAAGAETRDVQPELFAMIEFKKKV